MAPDLERLALTPWPKASLTSSGTSAFNSAFALSCSACAARVRAKIAAYSAQAFEGAMSTNRTVASFAFGGSAPNRRGTSPV
jgi:hypothetical protein